MTTNDKNRRDFVRDSGALTLGAILAPGMKFQEVPVKTEGPKPVIQEGRPNDYVARDYSGLVGATKLDEKLLLNHFTLYQGYVKNVNTLSATLAEMGKEGKLGTPAAAELRRRFGWEFNGMRLHELYFENLGGKEALAPASPLFKAIERDFGNMATWATEFRAIGAMRGIGWAALVMDGWTKRLFNVWINEHDVGALVACPVVLIMDVFEHAYIRQYELARSKYIEDFMDGILWEAAERRFG